MDCMVSLYLWGFPKSLLETCGDIRGVLCQLRWEEVQAGCLLIICAIRGVFTEKNLKLNCVVSLLGVSC